LMPLFYRSNQRPLLSTEALALLVSVFFALACNGRFFAATLAGRSAADSSTWLFVAAMGVMLVALHTLLLCLLVNRWLAKPLITVLILVAALCTFYMQRFGVFMDPTMLRNVLLTDPAEASELIGWGLALHLLLYAALPITLVWWVQIKPRTLGRALLWRLGALVAAAVAVVGALLLVFQDFGSLMRNQKELRYLITPAAALYSTARVAVGTTREVGRARLPVGTDASLGPAWTANSKPTLTVLVVGETARAANWGLSGYSRQTTPQLAQLGVLNFHDVTACGTNTETSLPCMFSAVGRRDYDEDRIRGSQGLLHVLARAGFQVLWRDNQSGCKGVCDGLPQEQVDQLKLPDLCPEGRCLDAVLLHGLDLVARDAKGNLVVVLHMLGNHGPAYYKRYPPEFRRFTPTCETGELRKCSAAEIVNAFDNALLYTDHVLAQTIEFLKKYDRFDTAMLYLSDHGESLGEKGLYLHGVPYAIAPDVQLKVPMVWWLSEGFSSRMGLNTACLAAQTRKPWLHDHWFHSVLGLLQVRTSVYEGAFDITAACRAGAAPGAPIAK
jgi:lipid A ethanolaminephosphotransferase